MKILNIGSLNIDKVYAMDHFVAAGETLASKTMDTFPGGKGLNQAVAAARAGAEVYAAGAIGPDGQFLVDILRQSGANVDHVQLLDQVDTGHAIIQVDPSGQNCIITAPGANGQLSEAYIDETLSHFGAGDLLLVQNETNNIPYMMKKARERGLKIAINASPINEALFTYPLELVDYFIINEIEGQAIAGTQETDYEKILEALLKKFPQTAVVLTLGGEGVLYGKGSHRARHGIFKVTAVDTTAAGDTFCGYFLASLSKGLEPQEALRFSSAASAITVSGKGAAVSIPTWEQVERFLEEH
jgi:ribokinase